MFSMSIAFGFDGSKIGFYGVGVSCVLCFLHGAVGALPLHFSLQNINVQRWPGYALFFIGG